MILTFLPPLKIVWPGDSSVPANKLQSHVSLGAKWLPLCIPSKHHSARASSEGLGDIAWVANTAVSDDRNAVLACFISALNDSCQLRDTAASDNTSDAATWMLDLAMKCPLPVTYIEPGPTPTLMPSAPAKIKSRVPSAVHTLPAITSVLGKRFFSSLVACIRWVVYSTIKSTSHLLVNVRQ